MNDGALRLPSISSPVTEDLEVTAKRPNAGGHLSVQVPVCPRFHRTDSVHEPTLPPHKQQLESDTLGGRGDLLFFLVLCGIEIAVIGGLSHFRKGQSTLAQFGQWHGLLSAVFRDITFIL